MGIDYDFGLAFSKACISADNELPLKGNIFISVNIGQKDEVIPIARRLRDLGLTLYGQRALSTTCTMPGWKRTSCGKCRKAPPMYWT